MEAPPNTIPPALMATLAVAELRRVHALLAPEGIALMPLKGVLLQRTVYAEPSTREMVDLDLLVSAGDFDRALEILEGAGYRSGADRGVGGGRDLVAPETPLHVDLHASLFPPGLFALETAALFARGAPDEALFGVELILPDPLDLYAHLVGHFAKGREDGSDGRRIDDLERVAAHHGLEATVLAAHLDAVGLGRAARYTLGVALERSGDPFAAAVLRELEPDAFGDFSAAALRRLLARLGPESILGAAPAHLMNRSLIAALSSLSGHALAVFRGRRIGRALARAVRPD